MFSLSEKLLPYLRLISFPTVNDTQKLYCQAVPFDDFAIYQTCQKWGKNSITLSPLHYFQMFNSPENSKCDVFPHEAAVKGSSLAERSCILVPENTDPSTVFFILAARSDCHTRVSLHGHKSCCFK